MKKIQKSGFMDSLQTNPGLSKSEQKMSEVIINLKENLI